MASCRLCSGLWPLFSLFKAALASLASPACSAVRRISFFVPMLRSLSRGLTLASAIASALYRRAPPVLHRRLLGFVYDDVRCGGALRAPFLRRLARLAHSVPHRFRGFIDDDVRIALASPRPVASRSRCLPPRLHRRLRRCLINVCWNRRW